MKSGTKLKIISKAHSGFGRYATFAYEHRNGRLIHLKIEAPVGMSEFDLNSKSDAVSSYSGVVEVSEEEYAAALAKIAEDEAKANVEHYKNLRAELAEIDRILAVNAAGVKGVEIVEMNVSVLRNAAKSEYDTVAKPYDATAFAVAYTYKMKRAHIIFQIENWERSDPSLKEFAK